MSSSFTVAQWTHGVRGQLESTSSGSPVQRGGRHVGLYFDQTPWPSDLCEQHHADIQANSPPLKADASSLEHLVVLSNYWCHPDSQLSRLTGPGWVTARGTCCQGISVTETQCEPVIRKELRSPAGSRARSQPACCNNSKMFHEWTWSSATKDEELCEITSSSV